MHVHAHTHTHTHTLMFVLTANKSFNIQVLRKSHMFDHCREFIIVVIGNQWEELGEYKIKKTSTLEVELYHL